MKILHCCLACFYIDDFSYQENLLPKFHKKAGHEVEIMASTEAYVDGVRLGFVEPSCYINEYGIKVERIPYCGLMPQKLAAKLRVYKNVYERFEESNPDVIFFHSPCSWELITAARYIKNHKGTRLYVDGHEDFVNSARTKSSRLILHGLYYRYVVQKTIDAVTMYWGTLPARCAFLREMYGVPDDKCKLLVMGADDEEIERTKKEAAREKVRQKLSCDGEDVLIVTGGKIDKGKWQCSLLVEAVQKLSDKVKLLVFGPLSDDMKESVVKRVDNQKIFYIPWANVSEAYDYFAASDLVVFPSTHSVYWEQAAGMGKPLLLRRWVGMDHVGKEGNVAYIEQDTVAELHEALERILNNSGELERMTKAAQDIAPEFLYSNIADRSIEAAPTGVNSF